MSASGPTVLCILDGWGLRDEVEGNAPALARTPNFDRIMESCPTATLVTHGPDVGLPEGQMGNSEVGHMNIGAGRVVWMDLGKIDKAIREGSFAKAPPLRQFIETLRATGGTAHLLGLVSDGGVHAHIEHMKAAAREIAAHGVPIVIHAVTDGRDVGPKTATRYVSELVASLPKGARIGVVAGRYYAMDRDHRWERVEKAWRAIALGEAEHRAPDAVAAVEAAYARGETDEFILPTVIGDYDGMKSGDGVFCLNFRADRAREILSAIGEPGFDKFDVSGRPELAAMLGMVEYSNVHDHFMSAIFRNEEIRNTLAEWLSAKGLRQFHLAETEKYPHVTFFFNGGKEPPVPGEDRVMVPSPKVATYDLQPEMSAPEVAEHLVTAITGGYDFIVVNFANPDMVGHTGDLDAAVRACEAVDTALGRALAALEAAGGRMLVTADHGNCETMIDPETGGPHTKHTTNPVPIIAVGCGDVRLRSGRLADIAPTILALMGLDKPAEMTGESLLS
ncbi:MAG: 2,3-bisphosphoglycerate-independent phosphoglycerate mutase [Alphaproteobacteria bacterium]|nr:MAG: 2,3-bisphosphoglycerate-independent phosphoglycerate mutase [Alphaproteobacteria bacterium]